MIDNQQPTTKNVGLESNDIVIIGSGPVGIQCLNELVKRQPDLSIKIFGDEPWEPYNRVRLTSLLSGQSKAEELYNFNAPESDNIQFFWNNRIQSIDSDHQTVTDSTGNVHHYASLVLALGSVPREPNIPGKALNNVFTLRNLDDVQQLMGRQVRSRSTLVIGAGLLGLEAAKAMSRFNTEVHCIEHSTRLMFYQLDDPASAKLEKHMDEQGINIHTNQRVVRINGHEKVESVSLGNGEELTCDTIIISTGIVPVIDIAEAANIQTRKGIKVNNYLQTNVPNIYAIGECAEHNEHVYGLVGPGYEQAAILAENLTGGQAEYHGSTTTSQLKVLDYPVLSMGRVDDDVRWDESFVYEDPENSIYRKLVIQRGYLKGVVATGEWSERNRLQEAVEKQRLIWPWQRQRFRQTGLVWAESDQADSVLDWPANATVCNCTGVTRGTLSQAMQKGADTPEKLCQQTGASSVCGSCRPLLQELTQSNTPPPKVEWHLPLLIGSLLVALASFILFFFPAFPYSDSVKASFPLDQLWQNNLIKQITGYSLIGMSVLVLLLSLRKRIKAFNVGKFATWRFLHVLIGSFVLLTVFLHTGFHMGDNLNFWLMFFFSSLMAVGAIASAAIANEHLLPRQLSKSLRKFSIWSHILLFWPIPALLTFHIIKSYYY